MISGRPLAPLTMLRPGQSVGWARAPAILSANRPAPSGSGGLFVGTQDRLVRAIRFAPHPAPPGPRAGGGHGPRRRGGPSGQAIVVAQPTPRPVDHTNSFGWRATTATIVPQIPTMAAKNTAESTKVGTAFESAGSGRRAVMTTNSSGHPSPTANAHHRAADAGGAGAEGIAFGNHVSSLSGVRRCRSPSSADTSILALTGHRVIDAHWRAADRPLAPRRRHRHQ